MAVLGAPIKEIMGLYIDIMDARHANERRRGFAVPQTEVGTDYDAACWNWALSASLGNPNNPESPDTIAQDIVSVGQHWVGETLHLTVNGINAVDGNYPGSANEFQTLRDNWEDARDGNVPARDAFKVAMLRIGARKNNLTPIAEGGADYTIHMKTGADEWNSWHHYGIGVRLPHHTGPRRIIVQTVPQTPVWHGCSVMWDEGLQNTVIGIQDLHQRHVDVINRIRIPIRCRVCAAVPTNYFMTLKGWHECDTCHSVFCPTHKSGLPAIVAKTWKNRHSTRRCNRPGCLGSTAIIESVNPFA